VLFYTLDTLPILLCVASYILLHPGYLLPDPLPAGNKVAAEDVELSGQQEARQQAWPADSGGKADMLEGPPSDAFQVRVFQE
jgi:hypothetical protein